MEGFLVIKVGMVDVNICILELAWAADKRLWVKCYYQGLIGLDYFITYSPYNVTSVLFVLKQV